nr:MAG TPA: hypothetical protein [Caudoviricetes sp.]
MLFHAFGCLSLPLLYRTSLRCSLSPRLISFPHHSLSFLNFAVLGYSHTLPRYAIPA